MKPWATIFSDFVDLLFPESCQACGAGLVKGEALVCAACQYALPQTHLHRDIEQPLRQRFSPSFPLQAAWGFLYFQKQGRVQRLLHALKYENQPEIGRLLGQWYGQILKEEARLDVELILPIPLHPLKQRKRGYNQSDGIADGLSQALQIAWHPQILRRESYTLSQTQKNKMERWENVKGIFAVAEPAMVAQKHILLVDDVLTTGATLEAAGRALVEVRARAVSVLTLAVAG
ncbi:MAG: ComF family protein [Microscillaceae bacterium]|nr:ComF family protein [Microscillaceae bacterium]